MRQAVSDRRGLRGRLARQARPAWRDLREFKAWPEPLVRQEPQERLGPLEPPVPRATLATLARRALPVPPGQLELLARLEPQARLAATLRRFTLFS